MATAANKTAVPGTTVGQSPPEPCHPEKRSGIMTPDDDSEWVVAIESDCSSPVAVVDRDAPKPPIRFIQRTYDDDKSDIDETEVSEFPVIPKTDAADDYKMTATRDMDDGDVAIDFQDPALKALVLFATKHLRFPDDNKVAKEWAPYSSYIYSWDNLEEIADLKEESLLVRQLKDSINECTPTHCGFESFLADLHLLKDETKLIETAAVLKRALGMLRQSTLMKPFFEGGENPWEGGPSEQKTVTWPWIWSLFRPGELLLIRDPKDPRSEQVVVARWHEQNEDILSIRTRADEDYEVKCWFYMWNPAQRRFKLSPAHVMLDRFSGRKAVTDLAVFPLKFLGPTGAARLKARLVQRGWHAHDLLTQAQRCLYTGSMGDVDEGPPTFSLPQYESWKMGTSALVGEKVCESPVIVDFDAMLRFGREVPLPPAPRRPFPGRHVESSTPQQPLLPGPGRENDAFFRTQRIRFHDCPPESESGLPWEDEQFLLLTGTLQGFHLETSYWRQFSVEGLKCVGSRRHKDATAYNRVVQLDENVREMVKGLVENHGAQKQEDGDPSPMAAPLFSVPEMAKSAALLFIFRGNSGSGKRHAARSLAAATGRPFYNLRLSQVNLMPKTRSCIDEHFRLAARWNAVLYLNDDGPAPPRPPHASRIETQIRKAIEKYPEVVLVIGTGQRDLVAEAIHSHATMTCILQGYNMNDDEKAVHGRVRKVFKAMAESVRDHGNRRKLLEWCDGEGWKKTNKSGQAAELIEVDDEDSFPARSLSARQMRNALVAALNLARDKHQGEVMMDDLERLLDAMRVDCEGYLSGEESDEDQADD